MAFHRLDQTVSVCFIRLKTDPCVQSKDLQMIIVRFTCWRFWADMGHQGKEIAVPGGTITIALAPGLKLAAGQLNQVRHHAVLAHGMAVQAIRAQGKSGTKVGPAEVIEISVPLIEASDHIKAAERDARSERTVPHRHA